MMRSRVCLAWLWTAALAMGAWAGEESRFQGETGLPAPLSRAVRIEVQRMGVHIAFPPPGKPGRVAVRSEVEFMYWGDEPVELEVGFPVAYDSMPCYDYPPHYSAFEPELPVTAVKLDGEPVPAKLLLYGHLAEPKIAGWIAEIARHLESVPPMYDPDSRAELWRSGPDTALQRRLAELDPTYEAVDLYEELSEEWGHAELMLSPFNGQLGRSYEMSGPNAFGAVVFPLVVEPRKAHTLVVHHKQWPGREVDHYSGHRTTFVALRYVLTRARTWGPGPREITIDVSVPHGWGEVALRPPATEVVPAEGGTTYRVRMSGQPLEELYVAVKSRE